MPQGCNLRYLLHECIWHCYLGGEWKCPHFKKNNTLHLKLMNIESILSRVHFNTSSLSNSTISLLLQHVLPEFICSLNNSLFDTRIKERVFGQTYNLYCTQRGIRLEPTNLRNNEGKYCLRNSNHSFSSDTWEWMNVWRRRKGKREGSNSICLEKWGTQSIM